jgi:hypothetical protein
MHIGLIIAAALAIAGGIELNYPAHYNLAIAVRKAGSVLFAVFYVFFVLLHAYYWKERSKIQVTRRTVSFFSLLVKC